MNALAPIRFRMIRLALERHPSDDEAALALAVRLLVLLEPGTAARAVAEEEQAIEEHLEDMEALETSRQEARGPAVTTSDFDSEDGGSNPPAAASSRARKAWRLARIREMFDAGKTGAEMAIALGISTNAVYAYRRELGLPRRPKKAKAPAAKRRFTEMPTLDPESVNGLAAGHPALTEGRTLFPTTVVAPADAARLLVSGVNSRKLGGEVTKGPWKAMPIYSLTLEERATCPRACHHWAT